AHRVILSAGSEYFKTMFTCEFAEKTKQSIEMKFMKPNILQLLVDFIYTGNMKITVENAQELIAAANMLMMSRAVRFCTDFLKSELHPSNAWGIYRMGIVEHQGLIYIVSGYMDFYNPMHDLLSYNPVTGEWRALAGRAPPRYNYMGVAVLNNFLYLVGGLLFNEEAEKSLERYSFEQVFSAAIRWITRRTNRYGCCMGIVEHQGLIYIVSGYMDFYNPMHDLLSYNPVTGEWRALAGRAPPRYNYMGVAVLNNFLYLVGGLLFNEEAEKSLERYSFEQVFSAAIRWITRRTNRYGCCMGIVEHQGLIYIVSGYMDFYNPMHDLLSYNPVTGEWRALAGRAPPRYNYMGVAVLNNFLYLVGGLLFNEEAEKSLERYSFEQ
ncbi:actin-binding protein IPP-like, partial [Homarus americanus]|uniref:actin-binding protein IPP-like n=1 Tax=Homarus americanus TaxID=6706 RepID=UPI001C47A1BE